MPAQRTRKILLVKQRILDRLRNGFYRPGDRFLSNRDVAELFLISYQTAHRLIAELCDEGHLQRRPQSGTYVPGGPVSLVGVQLVFHPRAATANSFGAKLLAHLTSRLDTEGISWKLGWPQPELALDADRIPVVWESPETVDGCTRQGRQAVLINDRPRGGLQSLFIDSVSTDDFLGGACAGELMRAQSRSRRNVAILAASIDDARSRLRVEGFQSVLNAPVIHARNWFFDDGYVVAPQVVAAGTAGIFCCNDQLASAVVRWCLEQGQTLPPLIGFDDAPVAESLNFTTIAIPWEELVDGVTQVVRRRLAGDRSTSSHQIFNPRPIIRNPRFLTAMSLRGMEPRMTTNPHR